MMKKINHRVSCWESQAINRLLKNKEVNKQIEKQKLVQIYEVAGSKRGHMICYKYSFINQNELFPLSLVIIGKLE